GADAGGGPHAHRRHDRQAPPRLPGDQHGSRERARRDDRGLQLQGPSPDSEDRHHLHARLPEQDLQAEVMASFAYYRSRTRIPGRTAMRITMRKSGVHGGIRRYVVDPLPGVHQDYIVSSMPFETVRGASRHKTYADAVKEAKEQMM